MLANAPAHAYRGQCTYCGHCKPCVANLDIAMINKFYDLATTAARSARYCAESLRTAGKDRLGLHRLPCLREPLPLWRKN